VVVLVVSAVITVSAAFANAVQVAAPEAERHLLQQLINAWATIAAHGKALLIRNATHLPDQLHQVCLIHFSFVRKTFQNVCPKCCTPS
jgi:hypothetical protein